jgi:predicted dehydrogenase
MSGGAPLRVGIAGIGRMGARYLELLAARPDVEVAALADPQLPERPGASAALARGARGYAEAIEMIDRASVDALIVALPPRLHYAAALAAIGRGIPLLLEKPLADTVEHAVAVTRAAISAGACLQVGHVERFNPAIDLVRSQIAAGALGQVFGVRAVRCGPRPRATAEVGVVLDLAIHDIDLISYLLGARPTRVYAEAGSQAPGSDEKVLYAVMALPGGIVAELDVNWLAADEERTITVLGTAATLRADLLRRGVVRHEGSGDARPSGETIATVLAVSGRQPLAAQLDAFLDSVGRCVAPSVGVQDGMWAVYVADALRESARRHAPVTIPASLDTIVA